MKKFKIILLLSVIIFGCKKNETMVQDKQKVDMIAKGNSYTSESSTPTKMIDIFEGIDKDRIHAIASGENYSDTTEFAAQNC